MEGQNVCAMVCTFCFHDVSHYKHIKLGVGGTNCNNGHVWLPTDVQTLEI